MTQPHLKRDYKADSHNVDTPFLTASPHGVDKPVFIRERDDSSPLTPPPGEGSIFLKQWLKNPGRLGTFAPISEKLARHAAACIDDPLRQRVVEIGAGPGRLTRAILNAGVNPQDFKALELDPELCAYAQKSLPHIEFIEGDAADLPLLLPKDWVKKVDVVFSTIPFMYLSEKKREDIVNAAFSVLKPDGVFLHLTYHWGNPLKHMILDASCAASVWLNFPPAFIWRYRHPLMVPPSNAHLKRPRLQTAP